MNPGSGIRQNERRHLIEAECNHPEHAGSHGQKHESDEPLAVFDARQILFRQFRSGLRRGRSAGHELKAGHIENTASISKPEELSSPR